MFDEVDLVAVQVTEPLAAGRAQRSGLVRIATMLAAAALGLALVGIHGVVA